MICVNCGHSVHYVSADACPRCGGPMIRPPQSAAPQAARGLARCDSCGDPVPDHAAACLHCGAPVIGRAGAAGPALAPELTVGFYTPPPVETGVKPADDRYDPDLHYAGWGWRVVASIIDSVLYAVVWIICFGVNHFVHNSIVSLVLSLVLTLISIGFLLMQAYTGATPGKRFLHIEVLNEKTLEPLGALWTIIREVAHILDTGALLIGWFRPLWHPGRKTFADSVVGSVVLHDD